MLRIQDPIIFQRFSKKWDPESQRFSKTRDFQSHVLENQRSGWRPAGLDFHEVALATHLDHKNKSHYYINNNNNQEVFAMCFFISLIPATVLTALAYCVLFAANNSKGTFQKLGKILSIWVLAIAFFILLVGAYLTFTSQCPMGQIGIEDIYQRKLY